MKVGYWTPFAAILMVKNEGKFGYIYQHRWTFILKSHITIKKKTKQNKIKQNRKDLSLKYGRVYPTIGFFHLEDFTLKGSELIGYILCH